MHMLTLAQTTQDLGGWFHDLSPFAFRISGGFGIRWYGLSYAMGFLAGFLLLRMLAKRGATEIPLSRAADVIMYFILGVLIGGRLFYVIGYEPKLLGLIDGAPWWGVLAINRGGMASHGGIVGVALACWRVSRGFKEETGRIIGRTSPLCVLDTAAMITPLGLLFGRLANFVNAELLGAVVAKPGEHAPWWAVRYPQEILSLPDEKLAQTPEQMQQIIELAEANMLPSQTSWVQGYERMLEQVQQGNAALQAQLEPLIAARYPTQLLQASLDGLLVLVCVWIVAMKPRKPGVVAGVFAIVYAFGRIPMDLIRLPDSGISQFGAITRGQVYSGLTLLAGVLLIVWAVRSGREKHGGWLKRPEPAAK
ncbi:MAG: prolipoprotein diacylglyceryl transferase [Phycisphaerae bacterium]|nr:prolipoprotein diacylglyceryl transferase [Phycisphaerae bacterium]